MRDMLAFYKSLRYTLSRSCRTAHPVRRLRVCMKSGVAAKNMRCDAFWRETLATMRPVRLPHDTDAAAALLHIAPQHWRH